MVRVWLRSILLVLLFVTHGAAVVQAGSVWHVHGTNCPGPGTGSLVDPFCTIQAGIDASASGEEVIVADGVYTGVGNRDLDFGGRLITVRSENGPGHCTIDCQQAGRAFIFQNNETAAATVEGFSIVHGLAPGTTSLSSGGGIMYTGVSAPTVRNCNFRANSAARGGAIGRTFTAGPYGAITVAGCTFEGNRSTSNGGALFLAGGSVHDCVFRQNTSSQNGGGAIYSQPVSLSVRNCRFLGNSALGITGVGGAVSVVSGVVQNCLFWANHADSEGSAILISAAGGGFVTNCTFSGHTGNANEPDRGVIRPALSTSITNCVVWGNSGLPTLSTFNGDPVSNVFVTYSDTPDITSGVGNIRVDPLFGSLGGNLRLKAGSPCIDAGNNAALPVDAVTDADGNPRFLDDPATLDTGAGTSPIVDMGAYEFGSGTPALVDADLNQDGRVDLSDFALFQSVFEADAHPGP